MVLTGIFLMNNKAGPLSICLLAIFIYLLCRNVYFYKIGFFLFFLLSSKSSLYILDTNFLWDMWFASIFSHWWVTFSLYWCVLETQKLKLSPSGFSFFRSILLLVSYLRNCSQTQSYKDFLLSFLLRKQFIILSLTCRPLNHLT